MVQTTERPAVSVIVPAYNATAYLTQCLDSLAAQTLTDIEVLMVNDGSTDAGTDEAGAPTGTLAMMEAYAAKDPRFVVMDKPNTGYGDNINRGIARATGEYLGILESDDFAEPDFLESLYTMAKEHDLDVARGQFWLYWSTPEERNVLKEEFRSEECDRLLDTGDPALPATDIARHVYTTHPAIWSALYKTEFLRREGIACRTTPGASFQDTGFNFKVWACARRVMLTQQAFIHYRQDNEASSVNNPKKVFLVCDEYAHMNQWLAETHPDLVEPLRPVIAKMQIIGYMWNFKRIAPQFREEFAARMRDDLRPAVEAGVFNGPLFIDDERNMVAVLMKDLPLFVEWRAPLADDAGAAAKAAHKLVTLRALTAARRG